LPVLCPHRRFSHSCPCRPRDLPPFPTRRSSDLPAPPPPRAAPAGPADRLRRPASACTYCNTKQRRRQQKTTVFYSAVQILPALRSEEHTSNSSHVSISYAVFCLKKKHT